MSNQGNQGPMSVKFTPWGVLAVSLVGGWPGLVSRPLWARAIRGTW